MQVHRINSLSTLICRAGTACIRRCLIVLSCTVPIMSSHAGQIYKCTLDGRVVFSQHPCADDAEMIDEASISQLNGAGAESGFVESVTKSTDRSLALSSLDRQISAIRTRTLNQVEANEAERSRCMDSIANQAASDADVDRNVMLRACHRSLIDKNNELVRVANDAIKALNSQKEALLMGPDREGGIASEPDG